MSIDALRKTEEDIIRRKLEERQKEIESQAQQKAKDEYQLKLNALTKDYELKKAENQQLKEKEIELLRKEDKLREQQEEMDIKIQKGILLEKQRILEDTQKKFQDREQLLRAEYEKKLEDQLKLAQEMGRKAAQGSMQLQGEAQELALETLLKHEFPFDDIQPVGIGIRGADILQKVKNKFQEECGIILYESKRTKHFNAGWIDKFKEDAQLAKADILVLVTDALPEDMTHFSIRNDVWICSFAEVKSLTAVLRHMLLSIHDVSKNEENKGEKIHMLYQFLTGKEFRQQLENIVESFQMIRDSTQRERIAMEKLWKEREKQTERAIKNAVMIYGTVKGIAGNSVQSIPSLELPGEADSNNELFGATE